MPEVVILEVGTNDLSSVSPEVVGSSIEDLVLTLKSIYPVDCPNVLTSVPVTVDKKTAHYSSIQQRS